MSRRQSVCRKMTWLLVVGIMIMIYSLSHQPATQSRQLSNHFIEAFKQVIQVAPVLSTSTKATLLSEAGFYIRKLAHMWIYALLGSIILAALWQTSIRKEKCFILALGLSTLYALIDEWHQFYVAGRSAELRDVLIDSMGALAGILVTWFMIFCTKKFLKG